jgi:hypothetical protein
LADTPPESAPEAVRVLLDRAATFPLASPERAALLLEALVLLTIAAAAAPAPARRRAAQKEATA